MFLRQQGVMVESWTAALTHLVLEPLHPALVTFSLVSEVHELVLDDAGHVTLGKRHGLAGDGGSGGGKEIDSWVCF